MSAQKFKVGKYYLFYYSEESWHSVWGLAKVLKRTPKSIQFSTQIIGIKLSANRYVGKIVEVKQENIVDKYGKDGKIVWRGGNKPLRAKIRTSDDDPDEYVNPKPNPDEYVLFDKYPTRYLSAKSQTDRLGIGVEEVQDDDRKLPSTATGKRKRDDKNMLKIKF